MSVTTPQRPPYLTPDHLSASAPEVRLLLICHAEGLQNRYSDLIHDQQASVESGLTAFGWEQTNLLAQWLSNHEKVDVLISAPMLRSRLTAQRLGQALSLPVTVHNGLPGRFAPGVDLPHAVSGQDRSIAHFVPALLPGDDSPYAQYTRALVAALDGILQEQWGKTVAVVLSGNGVGTAVRHFSGAHQLSIAVNHTGITELRRQDGLWTLLYLNRREHLPAASVPALRARAEAQVSVLADDFSTEVAQVAQSYNRIVLPATDPLAGERLHRYKHLLKFAQIPPESIVLDLGTGPGMLALTLAAQGAKEVVGIDVSPIMLESAEYFRLASTNPGAANVSFRLAPAQALPFRDERFDAVICRLLLNHSHRPQQILAESVRLLKRGGVFILADLLSADDPVKRATQNAIEERRNPSHVAARSSDQYRRLVLAAGLVIESEQVVSFEREMEEWLSDMQTESANRSVVREMIEAGLETDAAGLSARRQGNRLVFEQRFFYLKARKA